MIIGMHQERSPQPDLLRNSRNMLTIVPFGGRPGAIFPEYCRYGKKVTGKNVVLPIILYAMTTNRYIILNGFDIHPLPLDPRETRVSALLIPQNPFCTGNQQQQNASCTGYTDINTRKDNIHETTCRKT